MNMIEIKKTLWVVFICLMGHIVALAQKYQVRPLDAGLIVQLCCKHSAR